MSDISNISGEAERHCEYCKEPIHAEASVCQYCGRSQKVLIERIKLASTVVAILMLVISFCQVGISSWQMWEARQKRVEAQAVLDEARRVLSESKKISAEIANEVGVTVNSVNASLSKTETETANRLEDLTKKILLVEDETENLINTSITKIDYQIRESERKLFETEQMFSTRTASITHNLENLKTEISTELKKLKWRDKLMLLSDQAISEGKTEAFEELLKLYIDQKDIMKKDIILSYMFQVKNFYLSGKRFNLIKIYLSDVETNIGTIETKMLIRELRGNESVPVRYMIAEELGNRKEKGVPEALYGSIKNDKRLDVVVQSVKSFKRVTGYKSIDVFGGEHLNRYWRENKKTINKTLKKPLDLQLFKQTINYAQFDLSKNRDMHNYFDTHKKNIINNIKWISPFAGQLTKEKGK